MQLLNPQPALPVVHVNKLVHRNKLVLLLSFGFEATLKGRAKMLGATFTKTHKGWWLPWSKQNLSLVFEAYRGIAWLNLAYKQHTEKNNKAKVKRTLEQKHITYTETQKKAMHAMADKLRLKNYSANTFRVYGSFFKAFIQAFNQEDPAVLTAAQIHGYFIERSRTAKLSASAQNQMVNAIKFYYEKVLGRNRAVYDLERPKLGTKLPTVISQQELVRMVVAANNLKHRMIIICLYSAGLRRNELINLRLQDIDADRMQLWVRGGKGSKDRQTLLSQRLLQGLRKYVALYKPKYWLFESPERKMYSASSVGMVVKRAAENAGILKKVTPHTLRHSFATHLLEQGTDTRYIQQLLGHASLETTAIYEHVSQRDLQKLVSPLDNITFNPSVLRDKN